MNRSTGAFAEQLSVQELSERDAGGVGLRLQLRPIVAGHAYADDLVAGFAADGGGSAGGSLLRWHGSDNIRPRNVLTGPVVTGHNKYMTTTAAQATETTTANPFNGAVADMLREAVERFGSVDAAADALMALMNADRR